MELNKKALSCKLNFGFFTSAAHVLATSIETLCIIPT